MSRFSGADLWLRSAVATRAAGFITMFVLLLFAGALAAKRDPKLVARGAISALVTALAVGIYFAAAAPRIPGAGIGHGMILYAIGIVLGGAALALYLRRRHS